VLQNHKHPVRCGDEAMLIHQLTVRLFDDQAAARPVRLPPIDTPLAIR